MKRKAEADATHADRTPYLRGHCDAMAIALHRRTRLPYGLISGHFTEDGEHFTEDCHAVVVIDRRKRTYLDATGIHHGLHDSEFFFINKVTHITLRTASQQEIEQAFCTCGVEQAEIDDATSYIMKSDLHKTCLKLRKQRRKKASHTKRRKHERKHQIEPAQPLRGKADASEPRHRHRIHAQAPQDE